MQEYFYRPQASKWQEGLSIADGTGPANSSYCRHCGRETESATERIEVGGVQYEVSYCSNCGIAGGAFRLTDKGKSREGVPENILLRKMHRPDRKEGAR